MAELLVDLVRHGECEGGEIFRGHNDALLSAEGWQTMHKVVTENDRPWSRIISSPLVRCAHFAETLATRKQVPLMVERGFTEISFGDWEGQLIASVWQEQTDMITAWCGNPHLHTPPGGEAFSDFSARVDSALQTLLHDYPGEHILLISHGGVIRHLLVRALKLAPAELSRLQVPYGCLAELVVNARGLQVNHREKFIDAD
ncbi:MAG TPA: histidine phosphatase family protein [Cellvibrionaceae bacterium]